MSYQTGTWLPWFIKRYIFWNKSAHLKPLYTLDHGIVEAARKQQKHKEEVGGPPHTEENGKQSV